MENIEEDISTFEKIISLNKLGALFLSSDKYDKALSFLKKTYDFYQEKKANKEIPNFFYSNLYCNLAKAYSCLKQFKDAEKIYIDCIINHPINKILMNHKEFIKENFLIDVENLINIEKQENLNITKVSNKFDIIMNYFSIPNNNLNENFNNEIINKFKPNKLNSLSSFTDSLVNLAVIYQHLYKESITAYNMYVIALICEPDNNVANINFNIFLREVNLKTNSDDYIIKRINYGKYKEILENKTESDLNIVEINSINAKENINLTNDNTISFVCMKWGTKYDSEYVNKLFRGIKKNTKNKFNFFCITDNDSDLEEEIKILKLESNFKGWMRKSILFSNNYISEITKENQDLICFIDLDMIICGDLNFLWDYKGVIILYFK